VALRELVNDVVHARALRESSVSGIAGAPAPSVACQSTSWLSSTAIAGLLSVLG
jgi:hypothetical protein